MPELIVTSHLLIVLAKISVAWGIESSTCGKLPQHNSPHLTHSKPTRHWPWHAAIYHRQIDSDLTYECGGTVINQNWILTACHCVFQNGFPMEPNEISVSLGRLNLSADEFRSEQTFNVTRIIRHENYGPTYLENDIALIRLSHTAIFNHFVRPVCLSNTDIYHVTETFGTVVGWGKTETFELSIILQEANLKVVSHARCLVSNRDFYGSYLTETNFCAGTLNGTSVCQGDSGGSMTFEEDGVYYIRGIVSSSPSIINHVTQRLECDTMQYAIYNDVAKFVQWIEDVLATDCQTILRCARSWEQGKCIVDVDTSERKCEIIFDEISGFKFTSLVIGGESEFIPGLSDAIIKFENLVNLKLSNVKLKVVERVRLNAFGRILKLLLLSHNRIAQLDADTFGDLKELVVLALNNNTIKELHVDVFKELHNLVGLYLDGNQLENVPEDIFRSNQNLRLITLNENNLTPDLPHHLFRDNKQLQEIRLYRNRISELHADIFAEFHNLTKIYLYENQIKILPDGLFRSNQKLEEIDLSGNLIRELHIDVFSGLDNLTDISLTSNKLEILPQGLFRDNHQLQRISLDKNRLKELHVDTFNGLYNLEELYLYVNQIEALPQYLFRDNRNLITIGLQDNRIMKVESDFSSLSKLRLLNVRGNVCIDEDFELSLLNLSEISSKILIKCSN